MADKKKGKEQKGGSRSIAQNRKAFHDYFVKERFEAGIALTGTEVKSCRANGVSLVDSYATIAHGEVVLLNVHIAPYARSATARTMSRAATGSSSCTSARY